MENRKAYTVVHSRGLGGLNKSDGNGYCGLGAQHSDTHEGGTRVSPLAGLGEIFKGREESQVSGWNCWVDVVQLTEVGCRDMSVEIESKLLILQSPGAVSVIHSVAKHNCGILG